MSRKLQDLASQVIALRRPLDDAKTRAQVGMEGTARLQGQLRSVAEARDAAERECDAAKDECEVAARERDVAVWSLMPPSSPRRIQRENVTQCGSSSKVKFSPCWLCPHRGLVLGVQSPFFDACHLSQAFMTRWPRCAESSPTPRI